MTSFSSSSTCRCHIKVLRKPLGQIIIVELMIVFMISAVTVAHAVTSGSFLWARKIPFDDVEAAGTAVDKNGNVYALATTGYLRTDIHLTKYGSGGRKKWSRTYDSGRPDVASAIVVDRNANIYILGSAGEDRKSDIVIIKYNSLGQRHWVRKHNGPGGGRDKGQDIIVDADLNIYVTGSSSANRNGYRSSDRSLFRTWRLRNLSGRSLQRFLQYDWKR